MQSATDTIQSFQTAAIAPTTSTKDQTVTSQGSGSSGSSTTSTDDPFISYLKESLGKYGSGEVNEEEVFSSLIGAQLQKQDPAAADFYQQQVTELSKTMARADGSVPEEDVAKAALKATVKAGKITAEQGDLINGEAFAGAQLDTNTECLYDSRGTTKAVASPEEAMFKVKQYLDAVSAGTAKVAPRSLDIPSNQGTTPGKMLMSQTAEAGSSSTTTTPADGSTASTASGEGAAASASSSGGGASFLSQVTWKVASSDGNAAAILPTRLTGKVSSVGLYGADGKLIEELGSSKSEDDGREVYRFKHPGGSYGKNLSVAIKTTDGEQLVYKIPDGSTQTTVNQDSFTTTIPGTTA